MSLLVRLKKAINKVAILLSFDTTRWLIVSGSRKRWISFTGHPGLLDFVSETGSQSVFYDTVSLSRTISSTSSGISRSESNASQSQAPSRSSSLDDVDRRAEEFINNFRDHLRRELSLHLPYSRENSLEISSPN